MSEESGSHHAGSHGHGAAWSWGIAGAVLLYVLSPPPLAWMFERLGWEDPQWPQYVYAPLIMLYDQFEPVENFYDAYSELLGVDL